MSTNQFTMFFFASVAAFLMFFFSRFCMCMVGLRLFIYNIAKELGSNTIWWVYSLLFTKNIMRILPFSRFSATFVFFYFFSVCALPCIMYINISMCLYAKRTLQKAFEMVLAMGSISLRFCFCFLMLFLLSSFFFSFFW